MQGVFVGLLTCAPVGPIGVLAARRTLTDGRLAGFLSLLGASTADGIYCALVGLGIHAVAGALNRQEVLIRTAGGLILAIVGLRIFIARPVRNAPHRPVRGLLEAFTSTLLLVLANPTSALVFAAAFTAFGIRGWSADTLPTLFLVVGVFLGSATWSPVLVSGVARLGVELNLRRMRLVNRVCGSLIAGVGMALGAAAWLP
jgi:threonine/homoserine/homoserine lactone efflux protein